MSIRLKKSLNGIKSQIERIAPSGLGEKIAIKKGLPVQRKSSPGKYAGFDQKTYKGFKYQSQYIAMSDGVKLALDVFLPKKLETGKKIPVITYFVRYVRTLKLKAPFHLLSDPHFGSVSRKEVAYFTKHGYACAIIDLRGSGASFGTRSMEFSPQEVKDMGEAVDWLIAQSWSNGKVGSTGISYTATTAELLLANKHSAVKACIPRCGIFDLYEDMLFPGGVRQSPFIEAWKRTTRALDNGYFGIFGKAAKALVKGTNPVNTPGGKQMLKDAIKEHEENFDVFEGVFRIDDRNETDPVTELTPNDYSIHSYLDDIKQSGAAIYRISGWYDGGLVNSALKGFVSTPQLTKKVLIGPWDHGPDENISPFKKRKSSKVRFDVLGEMRRFFDRYLKDIDNGIDQEPPICYYNMGKEEYELTPSWPPPQAQIVNFPLSANGKLVHSPDERQTGALTYHCDYTLSSGNGARWNSLTIIYRKGPIGYADRSELNKRMLCFTAQPAAASKEITGHPVVDLYVSADSDDATLFVYLEDVAPDGSVQYITEGQFRALHRKVSRKKPPYPQFGVYHTYKMEDRQPLQVDKPARLRFTLQPCSYLLQKGHRLRLSIATSDYDHFDLPENMPSKIKVYCSKTHPSSVGVPVT